MPDAWRHVLSELLRLLDRFEVADGRSAEVDLFQVRLRVARLQHGALGVDLAAVVIRSDQMPGEVPPALFDLVEVGGRVVRQEGDGLRRILLVQLDGPGFGFGLL